MPYESPSVNDFITQFPRFSTVDPLTIQPFMTEAANHVDESFTEGDFRFGLMLYTAHLLTLEGLGSGQEAKSFLGGTADLKVIRSGALTVERFEKSRNDSVIMLTSYGKRFAELRYRNRGGMRSTGQNFGTPFNSLAFDGPAQ